MSAFDGDDDDARVADTEAATEVAIGDATERPKVHREKYGQINPFLPHDEQVALKEKRPQGYAGGDLASAAEVNIAKYVQFRGCDASMAPTFMRLHKALIRDEYHGLTRALEKAGDALIPREHPLIDRALARQGTLAANFVIEEAKDCQDLKPLDVREGDRERERESRSLACPFARNPSLISRPSAQDALRKAKENAINDDRVVALQKRRDIVQLMENTVERTQARARSLAVRSERP